MPAARVDQAKVLIERFRLAHRDHGRAVLEGFHAIKHALRFQAAIEQVCAADPDELWALTRRLAPDIEREMGELVQFIPPSVLVELTPRPPETGIIAIARRPHAEDRDIRNLESERFGLTGHGTSAPDAAGAFRDITCHPTLRQSRRAPCWP